MNISRLQRSGLKHSLRHHSAKDTIRSDKILNLPPLQNSVTVTGDPSMLWSCKTNWKSCAPTELPWRCIQPWRATVY